MKLIDIEDEALWKNLSEGGRSAKQVVKLFMKQRTVEAIPIEWIERYIQTLPINPTPRDVRMMIEYWRREND